MTDWLSVMERGLKAVRYGIFQASDNLAMLLDGLCRAPEEPPMDDLAVQRFLREEAYLDRMADDLRCTGCGALVDCTCGSCDRSFQGCPCIRHEDGWHVCEHGARFGASLSSPSSAASPQVAVVAPSPKQGSDSPPTDCSIPPLPVGGHPNPANDGLRAISDLCGVPYSVIADCLREIADDLDPK